MRTIISLFICLSWIGSPLFASDAADGQAVFQKQCSRCHKLPEPQKWTAQQWDMLIDVMQLIMAQRGVSQLTDQEKGQVLAYLKQEALQAESEQVSRAKDIFVSRCALCHQLPEPSMLRPKQWGLIMKVMQQRMQQANVPQLNDQEFELILKYLQERARN